MGAARLSSISHRLLLKGPTEIAEKGILCRMVGFRRQPLRDLLDRWLGARSAIMNVSGRSAVNQEAEQFGPAVMPPRIHELLAFVDHDKVEISDDDAFA